MSRPGNVDYVGRMILSEFLEKLKSRNSQHYHSVNQ